MSAHVKVREREKLTLAEEIEELTGINSLKCYQCGKCSAGCPVRVFMKVPPNKVVRFVQLGLEDEALRSETIWMCAGCLTCSTRCPQNFDLAKFMDALKEIAIKKGVISKDDILKFHKAFLKQVEANGKAFEFGLIRDYKLATFNIFQDLDIAPEMFFKGKIKLFSHRIKDRDKIKKIFDRCKE
ncbi:MAG: 4Fe-4S dicluster domain-containing protein [Deltaproteobacteria bacterium]|nr:4Fe-4S dicluster domain-containing protein [Deltaproteobacteria bacterium]